MTLAKIIDTLKMIALKHPNINSAYEGNIYDILNAKTDNKYASVVLTQQSHTTDETYDHYGFVIFYVDRLVDDLEENRVQIQSIGKSMLGNIITAFCNEFEAECDNISYQPFTQKFADETAGVYCTITIDTLKDVYCAERYWDESWTTPIVSIKNVDMSITLTENGHYTLDYDPTIYTGIGKVDIDVDFNTEPYYNDGYNNGYDNGKNDGYNEGFSKGEQVGYGNGYESGANEQKSKLEHINITENGTYTREDGYNTIEVNVPDLNGSYEEGYNQGYAEGEQVSYNTGYEQGQADIAANARVLEVTENGYYLSKFSDTVYPTLVTGVYDDGTEFYNYTQLVNQVYITNITVTQDSVVELWYKGDNEKTNDGWNTIFGCTKGDDTNFYLGYRLSDNNNLRGFLGEKEIQFSWDDKVWHHIIMKNDGLWIDDVLIGSFNSTKTFTSILDINGTWDSWVRNANGCFGMIKIDDVVIIPTEEGFLNVNTGELLEVVKDGDYVFTDNPPKYGEGELYKTINVNVQPKINVAEIGLKFGYSTFETIPDIFDFKGITNLESLFQDCTNLKTIPLFDTSKVTTMKYAFDNCRSIKTIPQFDTSKVTTMYFTFINCANLQSIPKIDCSSIDDSYNSTAFFGSSTFSNLTDIGGFENLKISSNGNYGLNRIPNLTYQSCINVLNGLYDFTGNGETPNSSQGKLKVHQNFLDLVGEEISIGTNKGWTITA